MELQELEKELKQFVKKKSWAKEVVVVRNEIKKDVEILLLKHMNEQRALNDSLYADKEVENVIKWVVRITTGALVTAIIGISLSFLFGIPVI